MAAEELCPALFVTGVDTGIGKTIVTAALARHFKNCGLNVGVMKPVETGVADVGRLGEDGEILRWAAGSHDPDDFISPYRFRRPLAPSQAAEMENTTIDIQLLIERFRSLRRGKDLVLVEGAGGLMVPVRGGYIMADLARQMGLPLLVVTHPRLGTLNHTLLTTFAARAMELEVSGFIINDMPVEPDDAEREAPHLLASLASADLLGVLPRLSGSNREIVEKMSVLIGDLPAYNWLLGGLGLSD